MVWVCINFFVFFIEKKEKDNSIKENDKEADHPEQAEVFLNFCKFTFDGKESLEFLLLFGCVLNPIRPLVLDSFE